MFLKRVPELRTASRISFFCGRMWLLQTVAVITPCCARVPVSSLWRAPTVAVRPPRGFRRRLVGVEDPPIVFGLMCLLLLALAYSRRLAARRFFSRRRCARVFSATG